MKKTLFTLAFMLVLSVSFAQKAYMYDYWRGTINGNINITIGLVMISSDNKFEYYQGTLQYGNNPQLTLSAKIRKKDRFIGMTESDSNGNTTGFFNGYVNGNLITGVWSDPTEKRKYNFRVKR